MYFWNIQLLLVLDQVSTSEKWSQLSLMQRIKFNTIRQYSKRIVWASWLVNGKGCSIEYSSSLTSNSYFSLGME